MTPNQYNRPDYMSDAPRLVISTVDTLANAVVESITSVILESYPGVRGDSREFREMTAAVFHRAEWLCRKGGEHD